MANDSPRPKDSDGAPGTPVVVPLTGNKSKSQPRFTEAEVKAMTSKKYMDNLVVPTLLKALAATNKQRPTDPVEFLGNYLLKCSSSSSGGGPGEASLPSADTDIKEEASTKEEKME